jgi:translation initiation factor IF-1
MAQEGAIEVEGAIVEVLPNKMYRVELTNGHRVLAYVTGQARLSCAHLAAGDKVRLDMSPYDLSKGRIVLGTQTD